MSNQKPRSSSRSPKAESKSMVLNSPSDNNPNMKTKLCRHWKRGQCTFSEGCRFAHGAKELRGSAEVFKTSICRFWLMDACVAGTRCRHAHGEHELRDRTADATEIRDSTSPLEATPSVWNTYSSHHDNSPPHQNLSYNHSNGSPTNAVSPTSQSSLKARPNATNDPATTKTAKRMPLSLPSLPVTLHAPVADQTSSFAREEKSTQESAAATGGSLRLPLSSKRNEQLKISVSGLLEEDETTRSTSEEVAYNKRIDLSLPPTNTNHPHVHHVNPYDSSAAYPLHTPSASFSSPHPSSYYKLQSSHPQPKLANHAPFPFSPSSAKHTPHHLLSSPVASLLALTLALLSLLSVFLSVSISLVVLRVFVSLLTTFVWVSSLLLVAFPIFGFLCVKEILFVLQLLLTHTTIMAIKLGHKRIHQTHQTSRLACLTSHQLCFDVIARSLCVVARTSPILLTVITLFGTRILLERDRVRFRLVASIVLERLFPFLPSVVN
eukprot:GDKK01000965.1.p2 GENE.GDKK01000965.1~~GDKK01000965.1.p2  ORF type:complete len:493 (+),score=108.54 GDKK01000965.1:53-1531(+)